MMYLLRSVLFLARYDIPFLSLKAQQKFGTVRQTAKECNTDVPQGDVCSDNPLDFPCRGAI